MNINQIVKQVGDTLTSRGVENGYDKQTERSAAAVAALFNAKYGMNLEEKHVWQLLVCLKEVRLQRQIANGADISDTLIDLVSYNALLAECLSGGTATTAPVEKCYGKAAAAKDELFKSCGCPLNTPGNVIGNRIYCEGCDRRID